MKDTYSREEVQAIIDCIEDPIAIINENQIIEIYNKAEQKYIDLIDKGASNVGRNVVSVMKELGYQISDLSDFEQSLREDLIVKTKAGDILTITKPIFKDGKVKWLVSIGHNMGELEDLQRTLTAIERERATHNQVGDFVYQSPEMKGLVDEVLNIAESDVTVLLQGETGTGKELVANLIVQNSLRKTAPYVKINCAAIQENLIESELFGYEAGSFTGAAKGGRIGLFEAADGGTLLLDEVGELPLATQAKLLRVLQEGEVMRVGGHFPVSVDVRIIASTNANLKEMVEAGSFRSDLYYRLNIFPLTVPSLTERKRDIAPLVQHYLKIYNKKYKGQVYFDKETISVFENYTWPGNVRELQNFIERIVLVFRNGKPDAQYILKQLQMNRDDAESVSEIRDYRFEMENFEKNLLSQALQMTGSGVGVARLLNLSESSVSKKLNKYNLK